MKHVSAYKTFPFELRSPWEDRENISVFKAPFFLVGYVLWLVVAILNTTKLANYFGHVNLVYMVVPFIMLMHEVFTIKKHAIKDFVLLGLLLLANVMTYFYGHDNLFAFSMLLFCGRYLIFKSVAKLTVIIQSALFTIIVISSQIGLLPDRLSGRPDGTIRHSLGFIYVTYPSYVLLNIVLLLIYIRKGKLKIYEMIGLLAINTYLYIMTDARNGCGLIFIAIVGTLVISALDLYVKNVKMKDRITRLSAQILCNDYSFFAIFFFSCTFFYSKYPNSSLMKFFDKIMSTRLAVSSEAVSNYGIPLVGGTSINLPTAGTVIDSSYLRIIFDHGLIIFLVLLVLLFLEQLRAFQIKDYWLIYVQLFVAVHSCFDAQLMTFQMNTFLFVLLSGIPTYVNRRNARVCEDIDKAEFGTKEN